MDHLIKKLKADRIAEIYSYGFPPQVLITPNGLADLVKGELFCWKRGGQGPDLVLFTADTQPNSPVAAYEISDRVLRMVKSLGVEDVYTVGAFITHTDVPKPRVFCTATEPNILKKMEMLQIHTMNSGSITWMNGLIMGLAKIHGMKGIFISGETPGQIADIPAAQAILDVLEKMFDLRIETISAEPLSHSTLEEREQVALTDEAKAVQTRYIS